MNSPSALFDLLSRHAWIAAAALVIGLLLRAAKEPTVGSIFARVPRQHRPRVVLALGVLSGVLDAGVRGTSWPVAILFGLCSGALAMAGHGALGGVSPAPQTQGELPISATGLPVPPAAPSGTLVVPPDLTPAPATTPTGEAPVLPIVEPSAACGPAPRPSER